MKKAVFIINPTSGRFQPLRLQKIHKFLNLHFDLTTVNTTIKSSGTNIVKQMLNDSPDLIIVAGGDGTINEVINAIAETSIPLGIIPMGTMNVLARELGIPSDPFSAAKILINGKTKTISLGNINGHYFSMMAGIGYDAEIVSKVDQAKGMKKKWGRYSYLIMGVKVFFNYTFPAISLTADGLDYFAYSAIISNIKHYGGNFQIAPQANAESSKFSVLFYKRRNAWPLIKNLTKIFLKISPNQQELEYIDASTIDLNSDIPVPIQIDGDFWGYTPAKIKLVPAALIIITT